jgi:hypothetical protein
MASIQPVVGSWYRNPVTGETFEVVALDEDSDSIGIQHFEGEVGELDGETWSAIELDELPPQEDWSGPFDDLEREEIELDGSARGLRWENPLDRFD